MKATGVVRRIDSLGRVVLPKELRQMFSIDQNDSLEIFVDKDNIVLKKYQPGCQECGEMLDLVEGVNTTLCPKCLQSLIKKSEKQVTGFQTIGNQALK